MMLRTVSDARCINSRTQCVRIVKEGRITFALAPIKLLRERQQCLKRETRPVRKVEVLYRRSDKPIEGKTRWREERRDLRLSIGVSRNELALLYHYRKAVNRVIR